MKILTLDIETSPHRGFSFGLFNQNFGLAQIEEWTRMICFAAKWHDRDDILFYSDFHDGHEYMVEQAYRLVDEADILVTYNGDSFDNKHMNREFFLADMTPPASYRSVDLYKVNRQRFRFGSTKLDHIVQQTDIGAKVKTGGFELWLACLNGDLDAWAKMRQYNKEDVALTEQLFDRMRPWISDLPNFNLYNNTEGRCPECGGDSLEKRGFRYTQIGKYQRLRCRDCGRWSDSGRADQIADLRNR